MALRPVILAGGSGTRLWPLSRELYPKQFLPLVSNRAMFQETLCRLDGLPGVAPALVVCNEAHRFLVAEQARELGQTPAAIILEPAGRNTAPALTLAALQLLDAEADPTLLVMPADHVIRDVATFQQAVRLGEKLAQQGSLVTFGIVPTAPRTGYGYIRKGHALPSGAGLGPPSGPLAPHELARFVEKPDRATAQHYLDSGNYLWNSGIFMLRASVWLAELERFRPDISAACCAAHANRRQDGVFCRPDEASFRQCPSDSIDYAVMERAAGNPAAAACAVIPLDAGWSDVGSWSAIWQEGDKDEQGNVLRGDAQAHGMKNSLLWSHHRLLAAVGLEDVIVVEMPDAVLVARQDRVEEVREIVARLKAEGRAEQENHRKVHRPWGWYEVLDSGPRFQVKRLTINPGGAISLQMHHHRAEHWVVVKGTARVTKGAEVFLLTENQSTDIPITLVHRLENPGVIPLEIIEVQSGSYLAEDDIVRLEDRYDRAKPDN